MSNVFPFAVSSKEYIIAKLNASLNTTFTVDDLTFGPVEPILGTNDVTLYVTSLNESIYVGESSIRIRRQDIGQLTEGIDLTINAGLESSVYGILNTINEKYRLNLTEDDVYDQTFSIGYLGPIELLIKPSSHLWVGRLTITLIPPPAELETVIVEGSYTDLVYPASLDLTRQIAEIRFGEIDVTDVKERISSLNIGEILGTGGDVLDFIPASDHHPQFYIDLVTPGDENLAGSVVSYNGPNEGVYFTGNYQYTNVCIIELGESCTKYAGKLVLVYN